MKKEQMLAEAERMRRVPGITFVDGASGRRARILGTGLEVFEIIQEYKLVGGDLEHLIEAFHWLTGDQILAALRYYREYPDEIDSFLEAADAYVAEHVPAEAAPKRQRLG